METSPPAESDVDGPMQRPGEPSRLAPVPGASLALARRYATDLAAPEPLGSSSASSGRERPITVDQTNLSVVVDEAVIVKWFDPPLPHPHPGLEVLAHLTELGFEDVPSLHGVERRDGLIIATVSQYLTGALDGWDWFVEELLAGDAAVIWAHRIGALAARLHLTLATPSSVIDEPVGSGPVRPELDRCRRLLEEASHLRTPEIRSILAPRADRIAATLDTLATIPTSIAIRIHEDLHVGQVLRAADRLVVTDFDGNPIGDPALAGRRRPAAVDVASLVQSVDHAGRVAITRVPSQADSLEHRITDCSDGLLAAYRTELERAGRSELLDERLLPPFRIAQELHELLYADRHLPRWTYAPLGALRRLLP